MKLFRQKPTGILLTTLLMLLACENQQDTFQEFVKDGETIYIGKPQVKAVPSGENKLKFLVTINADPKINKGEVLDVLDKKIHEFAVDRTTLTDNTVDFELTFEATQEGSQTYKVILMNEKGYKSMTTEITANILGRRYMRGLKTRTVNVSVGGKGVIFDWGDTLATSSASFIAYTNIADQATTVEVPKKVEREGEEVSNNQTILTDVKLGSTLEVYTAYKPSEEGGAFHSQAKEYPVNAPVITSISPLKGGEGTEVTITGENFHPTAAENMVLFGTVEVPVSTASATSLTVTVPEGITLGDHAITMKVGAATIPGQTFKVTAKE